MEAASGPSPAIPAAASSRSHSPWRTRRGPPLRLIPGRLRAALVTIFRASDRGRRSAHPRRALAPSAPAASIFLFGNGLLLLAAERWPPQRPGPHDARHSGTTIAVAARFAHASTKPGAPVVTLLARTGVQGDGRDATRSRGALIRRLDGATAHTIRSRCRIWPPARKRLRRGGERRNRSACRRGPLHRAGAPPRAPPCRAFD